MVTHAPFPIIYCLFIINHFRDPVAFVRRNTQSVFMSLYVQRPSLNTTCLPLKIRVFYTWARPHTPSANQRAEAQQFILPGKRRT